MQKFKLSNEKGFTLIELMIVVAIIGILAAIAIPNFMNYQCKANQREGQAMMSNLRTAMDAYYAEKNTYTDDFTDMNFTFKGSDLYEVDITSYSVTAYDAQADATLRNGASQWTLDEEGDIVLASDGCSS